MERVRVGDVLALQRRAVTIEIDGEYREIGVRSFGRGIFHKEAVSGGDLGTKRVFRIEPGDLVISNVFAWEGATAVATDSDAGRIGSHRFMTFVPIHERIDTSWAAWFFRSQPGLDLIRKASPGSAGRNRTLAIDRFEALEIALPSIEEQHRIAVHLDRLQTAATELAQRSAHASNLTEALLVSAAARPDLDDKAKAHAGWRRVPLGDAVELHNREVNVESGGAYDIAGVYSFGRGLFPRGVLEASQTSYKALHLLQAGQLVMSQLKAWEGALALVPAELDGWFVSPEFPTFDIDTDQVDKRYFEILITAERFWSRLKGASHGIGARRERVNATRLLEEVIELPPIESQRSLAGLIEQLRASQLLRNRVKQRFDSLVPAALNEAFAALN